MKSDEQKVMEGRGDKNFFESSLRGFGFSRNRQRDRTSPSGAYRRFQQNRSIRKGCIRRATETFAPSHQICEWKTIRNV
jgi:hypothetical protein